MKNVVVVISLVFFSFIFIGCGTSTPEQVVKKMIDAVQNSDGDAIVNCMSMQVISELDASISELKATPEESAEFLSMLGVEISADEVSNLTAGRFVSAILSSEAMSEDMPDFSSAVIGQTLIEGNKAMVELTVDGVTKEIELILEDNEWKLEEGLSFM